MNIWKVLKISPTSDIRLIKEAYAKQSRLCHPEDNPEMWQKINTAYRMALQNANYTAFRQKHYGDKSKFSVDSDAAPQSIQPDRYKVVQETAQEDDWFDFEIPKPPELSLSQQETENIYDALQYTAALVNDQYIRGNHSEWKKLLNSQVYTEVRENPGFLNSLAALLRNRVGYLKPKTQTEIFYYFNLHDYANASDAGKYSELFIVMQNARVMLADRNANKSKYLWYKLKDWSRSILFFCISLIPYIIPPLIMILIFIFIMQRL